MPAQFYSSLASQEPLTSTTASALITLTDRSTDFLTLYANYVSGTTFSLDGEDAKVFTLFNGPRDYENNRIQVVLKLNAVANHKIKSSYALNLKLVDGADTVSLALAASVTALNAPTFTSDANKIISDGLRNDFHEFKTDTPSTFTLVDGFGDNALFTVSTVGKLSLKSFASANLKSSYSVKAKATSDYANALTSEQEFAITVTDGNPSFLTGPSADASTTVKGDDYAIVLDDSAMTLTPSNIYVSDACTFTLGGADASHFTSTADATGLFTTIALKSGPEHLNIASYNLQITAKDAANKESSKQIVVTRASDNTNPLVTLTASSNVAKSANSNTFTIGDEFNQANPILSAAADENVTMTLSGTDSSIASVSADGKLTLATAILKNTVATYLFNIVATDSNNNVTTTAVTLVVSDKSAPLISFSSPAIPDVLIPTSMTSVPLTITTDEKLTAAVFATNMFMLQNASIASITTVDDYSATIMVNPTSLGDVNVVFLPDKVTGQNSNLPNAVAEFNFKYDPTYPVLTINGANPMYIQNGTTVYDEAGVVNVNNVEGILVTTGSVDNNANGTYYVVYTLTKPSGNQTVGVRIVYVQDTVPEVSVPTITLRNGLVGTFAKGAFSSTDLEVINMSTPNLQPIHVITTILNSDGVTMATNAAGAILVLEGIINRPGDYTVTWSAKGDSYYGDSIVDVIKPFKVLPTISGLTTAPIVLSNGIELALSNFGPPSSEYNGANLSVIASYGAADTSLGGNYTASFSLADFASATLTKAYIIKPRIVISGGTSTYSRFSNFTDDATFSGNTFNGEILPFTRIPANDSRLDNLITKVQYTISAGAWGDAIVASRDITIADSGDAVGGVAFTLAALSGSKLVENTLTLKDLTDETFDEFLNMPIIELVMAASLFNNIFLTSPSGVEQFGTDIPIYEVFATEISKFKTKSENTPVLANLATTNITGNIKSLTDPLNVGNMVNVAISQNIPEAAFNKWCYQIFGKENVGEYVFTNKDALQQEIATYLTNKFVDDLKGGILAADNLTHENTGKDNLTRVLMLQLFQKIYKTANYGRMTSKGMFADTNKQTIGGDDYYPFLFLSGDTLSFSVELRHEADVTNVATQLGYLASVTTPFRVHIKILMQ